MSLRYTQTDKWKDDWFLSLSNDYRIIFLWLVDSCTIAGVWKISFKEMNYKCNTNITESEFLEIFGNRLKKVDNHNAYFIPNYLKVQYPAGLQSNKPLIVGVRKEIEFYNLYRFIKEPEFNDSFIIKVKVMVKVTERGMGKTTIKPDELSTEDVAAMIKIPATERTPEQTEILRACTRMQKFYHLF